MGAHFFLGTFDSDQKLKPFCRDDEGAGKQKTNDQSAMRCGDGLATHRTVTT